MEDKKKTLIAMSGGVDSSVAAYLAKKTGDECAGVMMKLFEDSSTADNSEIDDARNIAESLGIPFYVFDLVPEFRKNVIDSFIESYSKGETPNPCIKCNKTMKFGLLFKRMADMAIENLATGHYAQTYFDEEKNRWLLKKAVDISKDQSYVLYNLTQKQLAHTYFPLGELTKDQVRNIANEQGFKNANKKESQDICFVEDGKYGDFIEMYSGKTYPNGNFIDLEGNVLGEHKGIIRYTIGQRRGLGLALKEPMYVYDKDVASNTVILARNDQLFSSELQVDDINLIAYAHLDEPIEAQVRIRYSQSAQPATVEQTDDDHLTIKFHQPQRAIAKGQAAVIYQDDIVVGGGTIIDG